MMPSYFSFTAKHYLMGVAGAALFLGACSGHGGSSDVPGSAEDKQPYRGIADNEVIKFAGTEPFWGGETSGTSLTYTTPENAKGAVISINRFAGRNGIGLSGKLDGKSFDMTVTPGTCSDGMSDRSYPFTVTLAIGNETRGGCAWSDQHPFTGPAHP